MADSAGIYFCGLEYWVNYLQKFYPIPLYMDTIFTITAAFLGGVSGFISALLYHVTTTYIYPEFRVSVFQSFHFFRTVVLSFFQLRGVLLQVIPAVRFSCLKGIIFKKI